MQGTVLEQFCEPFSTELVPILEPVSCVSTESVIAKTLALAGCLKIAVPKVGTTDVTSIFLGKGAIRRMQV